MGHPLRILVVEDSPDDVDLMILALRRGGLDPVWERVETAEELLAALADGPWDAVLSDYTLPKFGATAALEIVRGADPDLPFLVVSGSAGDEIAVSLLRVGANDYVLKHNLTRLAPAVVREVREATNRRARRAAERAAAHLAAIVSSSDDAIHSQTIDGVLMSWNPAAERLYGWTAAEAIGRHVSFLAPPENFDELAEIMRRLRAGERVAPVETVRMHRDGGRIDVSLTVSLVRDQDGRLVGVSKTARDIRERKRAEAALRRTTDLLTAVTEGTTDAVYVKDRDGKYLLFNETAAQFVGRTVKEVLGKDDTALWGPADARRVMDQASSVMESGRAETTEEVLTAAGVTRTYLATQTPYRDDGGDVIGIIGVARDITERRRLAAERDELLARLQLHVARMPLAYVLFDADLRVTDWNPAAEHILGYTKEEAFGMGPFDLVPPSFRPEAAELLTRIRAGDMGAHSVNENRTKDGRIITCEWLNTPLTSEGGQFVGLLCLAQDVTARREGEAALRLRDRAIQAVTQGILITDPCQRDNPIIYASPGFVRLTGYEAEEVIGRNCRFLQGKDTDPAAVARVWEALQAGNPCTVELRNYRKDGSPFWNELSISPVRDATGRLTHFVGVQADVTARRSLEEQFRQAQKMDAFGQLASGVAHDFNNLLTIINGYSDLLLQNLPAGDPSRELVAEIHKAGDRSAGLTRQLLAFSRQQVLAPRVLDLSAVVADTQKMLGRLIGEDLQLATTLGPALWAVRADAGQLEQVLMNLAVNARDAMPRGGRLTIETRNVELDETYVRTHSDARVGPHVLLSVSDSGSGMTPEVRARIFEPFFTTKGVGKGTGLGLATVYGIVKQSGGHLAVDSTIGVGTTFKVYLPRVEQPVGGSKIHTAFRVPPRGEETVLLVEDEEGVRTLTRHVLTRCGYRVLEAGDGDEAMRVAAGHDGPIHLLVTDVVMPGAGGRAVAERVGQRHPEVRVLFVSGYTDDAVMRNGVLSEGVNFLQKAFSPAALAFKVREVLDAPGSVIP
ncbi:MAG: hybrid sensor histidine kinase/response regulator [Gemmataceae bacterium]|nr:hybrid sensor histidine kinase/response regulator [Gemmataceae bacterium]